MLPTRLLAKKEEEDHSSQSEVHSWRRHIVGIAL